MLKDRVIIGIAIIILGFLFLNNSGGGSLLLDFWLNDTHIRQDSGINLKEGSNITIVATPDPGNNRVDYTISATIPTSTPVVIPTPDFPASLESFAHFTETWEIPGWAFQTPSGGTPIGTGAQFVATPIFVAEETTYIRISISVIAAVAGAECRLGIYDWDAGQPQSLIVDAGTVSAATTGEKEIVIAETLTRGYYFLARVCTANNIQINSCDVNGAVILPLGAISATGASVVRSVGPVINAQSALVAAGLPDPFPNASVVAAATIVEGCMIKLRKS